MNQTNFDFQKKERHLNISINFFCNLRCKFCSDGNKNEFTFIKKNSIDNYKKYIYKNRDKYEELIFTTWEPTLNKNIFEYAKYARDVWYRKIWLITNWTTLVNEDIRYWIINYIDDIIISIHWSNENIHDFLVSAPWVFKKVIKWFFLLKKDLKQKSVLNKKNINISFVLNKHNLLSLNTSIYLFIKLWVDKVLINTLRPDWFWNSNFWELSIDYNDFINYIQNLNEKDKSVLSKLINLWKLVVTDIPLCIILKAFSDWFEWCNISKVYWKMEIVESNWDSFGLKLTNNNEDKAFINKCKKCIYKKYCEWVFIKYIENFWEKWIWL